MIPRSPSAPPAPVKKRFIALISLLLLALPFRPSRAQEYTCEEAWVHVWLLEMERHGYALDLCYDGPDESMNDCVYGEEATHWSNMNTIHAGLDSCERVA